ncbi:CyP450 monooxygenase [Pilatotrama ljubarskyi]|nr:CyP450 monooxygenase [Pilatotrama ljubarskyi]
MSILQSYGYLTGALDLLAIVAACFVFRAIQSRSRRSLPPGPRGLPVIGNAFDIPQKQAWLVYRDLAAQYGDVVALNALGQTLVIVSSMTAAVDLFEKRSAIYSDRQDSILAVLTGWTWNLAFKRYGDDWRRVRRLFWKHFQPNAVSKFRPVQQREARRFLRRLLEDQSDLDASIKLSLSATILSAIHGLPLEDVTDDYVRILNEAEDGIGEAFTPGAFLVEFFPWLRHVPAWFPGAGWQKKVVEWRGQAMAIVEVPYGAAQDAMKRGYGEPSVLSVLLSEMSHHDEPEQGDQVIKETTAVAFGAGTDTTAATLLAFFCAMILHPEVQKRAREELDAVVGANRLPEQADRPSLPYVNAIVKELLRWHTVAPLGVAHRCMEEDEYRGWTIPKGAIIVPNAWAMLHDPDVFPEPEAFRPERFLKDGQLNPDVLDPERIAFGFGRRICPGRHFADDALFINVASVLHVFDIVPALDEHGQPIPVEARMTSGFLSYLEEFKYTIRPRSDAAEALIRADAGVAP